MHYLSHDRLRQLLDKLTSNYSVFVPVQGKSALHYAPYTPDLERFDPGQVRAFEPLKLFFQRAREVVAEDYDSELPGDEDKPVCIVGAKACDLKGFKVLDHALLKGEYEEPFYKRNRERNLIISCDCTTALDTCFCMAMGVRPFPEEGFDINLSPVEGGYLVEAGSEKGEALLDASSGILEEPDQEMMAERGRTRNQVAELVQANVEESGVPDCKQLEGAVRRMYDSDVWADEAQTCVECGACNTICPTCHCFLLYDQEDEGKMRRLRIWDSCLLKGFARVGGGDNPRPELWMRLRNRFEKKFDFFPEVADIYACTGCGRCITGCPAKIDIREVLGRLVCDE